MGVRQGYMLNALHICIDQYQDLRMSGRMYSPLRKEPLYFKDFIEMIAEADKLFDEKGYPQSYQAKRDFSGNCRPSRFVMKPQVERSTEDIVRERGEEMTFDIVVLSRQHATWQGVLRKTDGTTIGCFHDIMEIFYRLKEYYEQPAEAFC